MSWWLRNKLNQIQHGASTGCFMTHDAIDRTLHPNYFQYDLCRRFESPYSKGRQCCAAEKDCCVTLVLNLEHIWILVLLSRILQMFWKNAGKVLKTSEFIFHHRGRTPSISLPSFRPTGIHVGLRSLCKRRMKAWHFWIQHSQCCCQIQLWYVMLHAHRTHPSINTQSAQDSMFYESISLRWYSIRTLVLAVARTSPVI